MRVKNFRDNFHNHNCASNEIPKYAIGKYIFAVDKNGEVICSHGEAKNIFWLSVHQYWDFETEDEAFEYSRHNTTKGID